MAGLPGPLREGCEINAEEVRGSPLKHKNLNVLSRYSFTAEADDD
ncbi:hypothetical protein [Streptomyces yangpuensis]